MPNRIVLHIHTEFSHDSNVTLNDIINQCYKNNINCVGLTDHCNADAGFEYKKKLNKNNIKVIVGEEVKTKQGEIIGLFIKKTINCKKENGDLISLKSAINEIKKQGGLVFAPHPFDIMRLGIGKNNLDIFKDEIDAIEIFNSRTKINIFNIKAENYAKDNNITPFIGSDAHIAREISNSIIEMDNFSTKEEFLKNLKKTNTKYYKKRLKLIDIIRPTINKIKKKYLS